MENIFCAKSKKTTSFFKSIVDIVSQISMIESVGQKKIKTIKQVCFMISNDEFKIYSDSVRLVNASATLTKNFFYEYEYNDEEPMCIGISLDILKTCFKHVHRNDDFTMSIKKDPYSVFPDTVDFSLNNTKGFSIKFNTVQNIESETGDGAMHIVDIPSNRFSVLYKEIGGIKKKVRVEVDKKFVKFSSNMVDIAVNWVVFDKSTDFVPKASVVYTKSEYFKMISKLSVLDSKIRFLVNDKGEFSFEVNLENGTEKIGNAVVTVINEETV